MEYTNCPECGSDRIHRFTQRVKRYRTVDARTVESGHTEAGYYTCLDCWHKWDGICKDRGGALPAGVIARAHHAR